MHAHTADVNVSVLEWRSDDKNSNNFIFAKGPPSVNVGKFLVDDTPQKDLVLLPAGTYEIVASEGINSSNDNDVVFTLIDGITDVALAYVWGPMEGWCTGCVGTWATDYTGAGKVRPAFTLAAPTWVRPAASNKYTSYQTRCRITLAYVSVSRVPTTSVPTSVAPTATPTSVPTSVAPTATPTTGPLIATASSLVSHSWSGSR